MWHNRSCLWLILALSRLMLHIRHGPWNTATSRQSNFYYQMFTQRQFRVVKNTSLQPQFPFSLCQILLKTALMSRFKNYCLPKNNSLPYYSIYYSHPWTKSIKLLFTWSRKFCCRKCCPPRRWATSLAVIANNTENSNSKCKNPYGCNPAYWNLKI